ncbi:aspartate/glutamate racemase family protein [Bacillus sp. 2205SS5-2]|uniref:aspartate/glutamate racemase family protein n=1 Tax=Bacillus sp. 2205SS5-2 TaxID=3109031 RepID=UPI003004E4F7
MKTIGLIGGMSWESATEYYKVINQEVKRRLGGLHSAKCILFSVDFAEIEQLQSRGDWEQAGIVLAKVALRLEKAGADFIVLCTNTMHKVIHLIEEAISIPIVHIADATSKTITHSKIKTVGLLGTQYTMEQDFYTARINSNGIKVIIPNQAERELINQVIYHELCLGKIQLTSKRFFQQVIHRLMENGAEGIILGCTEIGLLIQQEDTGISLFDTTQIHAEAAVSYALKI